MGETEMKYDFTLQQLISMTDEELLRNYTDALHYYDFSDENFILSNLRNEILMRMEQPSNWRH